MPAGQRVSNFVREAKRKGRYLAFAPIMSRTSKAKWLNLRWGTGVSPVCFDPHRWDAVPQQLGDDRSSRSACYSRRGML